MTTITFDRAAAAAWLRQPGPDDTARADNLGIDEDLFYRDAEGFLSTVTELLPDIAGLDLGAAVAGLSVWLIPDGDVLDQGAIITIDLTDGIRLASTHNEVDEFADRDQFGIAAAVEAVAHIAEQADQLLAGYRRVHPGYQLPPRGQARP